MRGSSAINKDRSQRKTLHPKCYTLNPKPSILNAKPPTFNPEP